VKDLEAYLNNPLFQRNSRQVELTEEGQVVFSYAEKIFSLSDELEKEFADLYNLDSGTLKIGVAHVTLKNLVPNLISGLKGSHPNVGLQLFTGLSKEILDKIINYEYHVGVIARVAYPDNLIYKEIAREALYFVTREDIPEELGLKDLAEFPIVMQAEGAAHREIIINEFHKRKIPLNICIETVDPITQRSMVELGIGGAFLPLSTIEEDVKKGRFKMARIRDGLYFYFDAIFLEERRKSRAVRTIISTIDQIKSEGFLSMKA
ncbi:MAG: LysR family transcriptional regulator, partial [Deltaproteobacteria bacterium]|nr:LysR family transcriptional regulator [Deltaproteobacteria bacterium]